MTVDQVILIVLLTVVAVVTLLIIAYFATMCVTSVWESRKKRNTPVRPRSLHPSVPGERRSMAAPQTRRATQNSYIMNPTATAEAQRVRSFTTRDFPSSQGHTRITLPTNLFLNSHGLFLDGRQGDSGGTELEVMRFYTAEELLNFNFDEQLGEVQPVQPRTVSRTRSLLPTPTNPSINTVHFHSQRGEPDDRIIMQDDITNELMTPMVSPTPENPVFLRHPDTFLNPAETRAMESVRVQGRNRLCYSIPASYIGRPPAYLPTDDNPPSYNDVVKLTKIPEEDQPQQP